MERLKSELKTKMCEYSMLNKSLIEALEKNSNANTIDAIKEMIGDTENRINALKSEIEVGSKKKDKEPTVYSFYDKVKKPVKKIDALSDYASYDTPYNHLNYKNLYEIKSIVSNKFKVNFDGGAHIPSSVVKSVDYASVSGNQIIIKIDDYVYMKDGKPRPIIADVSKMKYDDRFPISIEHFDTKGNLLYAERFHGCLITDVKRTSLDNESDGTSYILLTINYTETSYETAH